MSGDHEFELQIPGSPKNATAPNSPPSKPRNLQRWIMLSLCTFFTLAGQTTATLLGRFYYDQGGNSKWLPTLATSAGFPILLPILFSLSRPISSLLTPDTRKVALIYTALGLAAALDNLMYSYGLLYLPVSTFSLVCATQLAFNVVFSHFLNSQKCTALILNSVVLLTISAALLAVSESSSHVPKSKYPLGYILTLGASAVFALLLSLTQFTFQKVLKRRDGFSVVLELLTCTSFVSSAAAVAGLFASGEWRGLESEMEGFAKGKASYVITLVSIAVSWMVTGVAATWLTFAVSSLYSNVIGTLGLPIVPIFAVVFFRDSMDGVKVVAMLIAVWGFLSYIYQDYLDDSRAKKEKCTDSSSALK